MHTVRQLLALKGHQLFSVGPQDSVLRAIEVMATQHVGALLVMEAGALLGVISERDYARKVILMNRSSHDTTVATIMSAPVITVGLGDTVKHCMEVCTGERIRHLPVVDGNAVVGIVSIGDLVKAMLQEQSQQIEQLERYIAG
ncbi:MAG TPA: CBS domain-containing protein [Steroidobacteraceae bacterium]|nr:CBS domain-containing protein [Steroidobacteraceae bacterium]